MCISVEFDNRRYYGNTLDWYTGKNIIALAFWIKNMVGVRVGIAQ
jgi:hypothetical protein